MNMIDKRRKMLTLSIAILAISVLFITTVVIATATAITVTRTLSTTNPASDSTFGVRLDLTGLQIGGIVETIPDGFAFVSTTHPQNQTGVSGQKVAFGVVNETTILYEVRAPSEGREGTFGGLWHDALSTATGDIETTSVSVSVAGTSSPAITSTTAPSPATPDFHLVLTLAGLLAVAYILSRKGKGGEGK